MKPVQVIAVIIILICVSSLAAQEVPEEVAALAGTYTGSWTMFGLDKEGTIIKKMSWTDVLEALNPEIKNGRAFVTTIDIMVFDGNIPPQKVTGKEGYFLNEDGSLGDYFMEMAGQTVKMIQIDQDVWTYTSPVNPYEYSIMGVTNVSYAKHVLFKVITREDEVETHRISRVTTVHWTGKDDKEQWIQFISLQGIHKRQSPNN
ncbi:hypothetical protein ACFLT9_02575 [Acidobacteriota bacterium]